ncbi:hypothetical protein KGG70_gp05 [Streptomyces phage Celia]|uniref:Uncharacterized protein n=1 Tax=Streptomyces phage Celia TaxID=2590946 RepID=A0A516KRG1_9CAUD|nr:hypothetical protein KGG70_gp05 [Streptomyces phage Celia]QDP44279.1 hypothetical protein SEA_CELIA_76 [Streptomyces phage Celia]QFG10541.1 hypothetical protein SEA_URZA_78 [Streptomyces phage Urza]QJD50644.1 hypothetical protein SEA_ITZA_79 [Streptomyces phage Itza]USH45912.1 hypothetical protein SEA_VIEENROSE_77 [Streptomyces phage VieEnRose]
MATVDTSVKIKSDDKTGLTLGDLRKLIEEAKDLDDSSTVKVTVGWRSQLTSMQVG